MVNSSQRVVVDTNVPIVANGRRTHADTACQRACIEAIKEAYNGRTVVLDQEGLIMNEYEKYLNRSGEPGAGDAFFKYLFMHSCAPDRVHRVSITQIEDEQRGFEELPVNSVDPGDRKFVAAALVANAAIVNATDSDWNAQQSFLDCCGLVVEQLCPQHADKCPRAT